MPRRTIKTAANSRRGAKRAKTSPRDENRANAAKTKKSVSRRACLRAQTRRRLVKSGKPRKAAAPPKQTPRAPNARKREAFTNFLQSEGDEIKRAASAAGRGRFPYVPRGAQSELPAKPVVCASPIRAYYRQL